MKTTDSRNLLKPRNKKTTPRFTVIKCLKQVIKKYFKAAKEIATGLINAGIKNSHVVVRKNEILIMDTDDINTAQKVWRFNVNGLGYSSTGYHGNFGLAMTMDGSIVADFINVGILNANLIKAGVIKSLNEKTWINMEDGTFSFGGLLGFDGTEMKIGLKL